MVSNIPVDSSAPFAEREAEKACQRFEQLQARQGNPNFVRLPSESGLARPRMILSSFGRPAGA